MVKENNIVQFFEKGVKILKDSSESFNIFEMLGQSSREMPILLLLPDCLILKAITNFPTPDFKIIKLMNHRYE